LINVTQYTSTSIYYWPAYTSTHSVVGQYCFAVWHLLSVVVCNTSLQPTGGFTCTSQAMTSCNLQSNYSSTVTLHGGPVVLYPVRATPC